MVHLHKIQRKGEMALGNKAGDLREGERLEKKSRQGFQVDLGYGNPRKDSRKKSIGPRPWKAIDSPLFKRTPGLVYGGICLLGRKRKRARLRCQGKGEKGRKGGEKGSGWGRKGSHQRKNCISGEHRLRNEGKRRGNAVKEGGRADKDYSLKRRWLLSRRSI